jgi:hypothetical protein
VALLNVTSLREIVPWRRRPFSDSLIVPYFSLARSLQRYIVAMSGPRPGRKVRVSCKGVSSYKL